MTGTISEKEIIEGEIVSEYQISEYEKEAKNEISIIVKDLEPETSAAVSAAYLNFLAQAKEWKNEALSIVVTDASQKDLMKAAKELRLTLQKVRTGADKVRKALKDDSNRYGKAVQSVYNEIEKLIAPLEKHLMDQEKYVEVQEEKRKAGLKEARMTIINSVEGNITPYIPFRIDLAELTEDEFKNLLEGAKLQLAEKIRKDYEEEVLRLRQEKLAQLGLRLCEDIYQYRDIKFHKTDLITMSEAGFEDSFARAKERRNELDKADEERFHHEQRQTYRIKKMSELGLKYDGEQYTYKDINFHEVDLQTMNEVEFENAFLGAKERLDQIKSEEKKLEKDRIAKLNSVQIQDNQSQENDTQGQIEGNDIEKLRYVLNMLRTIQYPSVESTNAIRALEMVKSGIRSIASELDAELEWM